MLPEVWLLEEFGLLGVDAVMAAGISTLIDSGIEDIRTGKINEIDIEKASRTQC